jgi:hypothetical protein
VRAIRKHRTVLRPLSTLYMTRKAISTSHLSKNSKDRQATRSARIQRKADFSKTGPIDPQGRATWKRITAPKIGLNLRPELYNRTDSIPRTPLVNSNPEIIDLTEEIRNPVIDLTDSEPTIQKRRENRVPNLIKQQKLRRFLARIQRTPENFTVPDYRDCTDVTVITLLRQQVRTHVRTVLSQVHERKSKTRDCHCTASDPGKPRSHAAYVRKSYRKFYRSQQYRTNATQSAYESLLRARVELDPVALKVTTSNQLE